MGVQLKATGRQINTTRVQNERIGVHIKIIQVHFKIKEFQIQIKMQISIIFVYREMTFKT